MSGADFDGDTVMCIPTHDSRGRVKIISKKPLSQLEGFDNKLQYGPDPDAKVVEVDGTKYSYRNGKKYRIMGKSQTNIEMGKISNLITDMTLGGAPDDQIAAAVKHSMVVIDAEKHKLDYKASYIDNNIAALKKEWQPKYDSNGNQVGSGGAATILSKSKSPENVLKRKGEARINIKGKKWYDPSKPEGSLLYVTAPDKEVYYADSKYDKKTGIKTVVTTSGKKIEYNMNDKAARDKYEPVMRKDAKTGKVTYTNKDGSISYRVKQRTIESTKMRETDDAYKLVSNNGKGHPMEMLYADYANAMKAMANKARKEMVTTGNLKSDPTAKKTYAKEVKDLEERLNEALKNSAKERTANRLTAVDMKRRKEEDPNMTKEEVKKLSQRTLSKYRDEVGAVSRRDRAIKISDREWEAIQAGAISERKLKQILQNSDPDTLRARAMPKSTNTLSSAQVARIKSMNASNFTLSQIAEKMNISPSLVSKYLKGEK